MARFARALTRILPALLLMLDAVPSAGAIEMRNEAGRTVVVACALAGAVTVPLPGTMPEAPNGNDPADLALMVTPRPHGKVVRYVDATHARPPSPERTWPQLHRRRAPSPDDPDPY